MIKPFTFNKELEAMNSYVDLDFIVSKETAILGR